jgi:hypothetical protein
VIERVLALGLCLFVSACAGGGPNLDVDPRLELGTGEVQFERLIDGQEAPTVYGIQGGYHIWGSVRATGMDWRRLELHFELLDDDGELVSNPTLLPAQLRECVGQEGCDEGMGEVVGITVFVDDPPAIWGDDITMTVVASDDEGRSDSDERLLKPGPE